MSMIGNLIALSSEQLQALIRDPDSIEDFIYPDDGDSEPDNHIDLDKAWHAIHFTLNGKAWEGDEPLFLTILGGTEIGEDAGYGPARYLSADQVKAVSSALSDLPREAFVARFNPSAMTAAEIYPGIWEDEDDDGLDYVASYYTDLRNFYLAASQRGDAVLIYLN
jgi:hypothetical protein